MEQLSYNYYGLMRVYDKIGEIYLERKQYQPALEAFQQGFILARSLNYKQDHFLSQIQRVNQGIQEKDIPNVEEEFAPTPNNIDTIKDELETIENPLNEIDGFEERFEQDNILR